MSVETDRQRSRVTVCAPTGRVDLTVPNRVPLALLLPLLFDQLKIKSRSGAGSWEIAGVDGQPISRDASLQEADIRDGDLLFVRRPEVDDEQQYDDVVEVICEEGAHASWCPRYTAAAAMASGVIVMLMVMVDSTRVLEPSIRALIATCTAAILGLGALAATKHAATRRSAPVAVVLAAGWVAVAANAFAGGAYDGVGVLAAAVAFGAACLIGCIGLRMTNPLAYAATALSALAATGGAVLLATGQPRLAAAIVAVAGIVSTIVAPAVVLRLTGVTALDNPQNHGAVPTDTARQSVRQATLMLSGLIAGITIATLGAVVVLAGSADPAAYALAVGVVALTLIRAATFRDRWQVGTLTGGGLCGLIAATAAIPWTGGVSLGALALVGAGCFLTSVAVTLRLRAYRLRRLGEVIETAMLIAVIPAVLVIGGAYGAVISLWD